MRYALTACLFFLASAAAAQVQGTARIVDGDTLEVAGIAIRLNGIDAPEAAQDCRSAQGFPFSCGDHATEALRGFVGARRVSCQPMDTDRYGRTVARCVAGGVDLGQWMVRQGYAIAYRRYSIAYVADEAAAQRAGAGFWSAQMQRPSEYREAQRAPAQVATGDCRSKGNVSGNGRIYHMPGDAFYEATRISPSRGERWFCSEAEARAAGWRAARR